MRTIEQFSNITIDYSLYTENSAMTLYLKYRPQSFHDVVGQDHVTVTLKNAIERDQLGHAYLFCGTHGTGKTSVARIVAKHLLMRGIEDIALKTQIEKAVEEGNLVDLIEIDAASNRRIDDVRDLVEKVQFSPVICKSKVYIIDEVHMLTKEAFNALLKTLEEPPPYAYFILATTELHKVPETIQSRCQRFLFKRQKDADLISRLEYIARAETINAEPDALKAIARTATGSFRDAISLLDQLRTLPVITAADVAERTGRTGLELVEEMMTVIEAKDVQAVLRLIEKLEDANAPYEHLLSELLSIVRIRMHAAMADKQPLGSYLRMIDGILRGLQDMRISPVPSLVLETTLLTLCGEQGSSESTNAAPASVKKPDQSQPMTLKADTAPSAKIEASLSAPSRNETQDQSSTDPITLQDVLRQWPSILIKSMPAHVRMSLKNGTPTDLRGSTLIVSFPSAFHRDKVCEISASRTIEDILSDTFKRPMRLDCMLDHNRKVQVVEKETDLAEAAAEVFGSM